jgi:hypothetical protein
MIKKILLLLGAQHFLISLQASITTATGSGFWGEGGNWDNGSPGCFDTIVIPAGITISIATTVDLEGCTNDSIIVVVQGVLSFVNGRKMKLPCNSDVFVEAGGSIQGGGGGGNSNYIEICGDTYWNAGDGTVVGPSTFCDGGCPTGGQPLPISLISFRAELNSKRSNVDLFWETASEVDNDYFNVERSADGVNWEGIIQVEGAKNSSVKMYYSEIDYSLLPGLTYYRLKQTNFDKTHSYSPAVSINHYDMSEVNIYPNPSKQGTTVFINFPGGMKNDVSIQLVSLDGKLVFSQEFVIKYDHQVIIKLPSNLEKGVYSIGCLYFSKKLVIK